MRYYRLSAFWAVLLDIKFSYYNLQMLRVNIINCKKEGYTKVYPFISFILSKNLIAGNIVIYKDLVIN